jgi:hypothetical protein
LLASCASAGVAAASAAARINGTVNRMVIPPVFL